MLIAIFTAFTLGYYAFEGETDTQIIEAINSDYSKLMYGKGPANTKNIRITN